MKISDLLKNDKYVDIAQKLNEVSRAQQRLFAEIIQPSALIKELHSLKTIESVIKELDKANSFKNTLSQEILRAPAMELARQANLAISGLSISSQMQSIAKETAVVAELWIKQITSIDLSPLNNSIQTSLLGIQSQIAKISEISLLAERSLLKINFNNIGALVSASLEVKDIIQKNHISFSESYASLFESLAGGQLGVLAYAPVVSLLPPIEFYNNNRFLEAISIPREPKGREAALDIELAKETNDELETILNQLDPSLIKLWRGAKEALNSTNPDAVRHFIISLRELLTHVIHELSPDDEVKAWSALPDHFYNNRPTRRARLLFICRGINFGPFNTFIDKDIDAILAFMDLCQEGTHAIDTPLSPSQLEALKNKAESSIMLLIRTWKDTNN